MHPSPPLRCSSPPDLAHLPILSSAHHRLTSPTSPSSPSPLSPLIVAGELRFSDSESTPIQHMSWGFTLASHFSPRPLSPPRSSPASSDSHIYGARRTRRCRCQPWRRPISFRVPGTCEVTRFSAIGRRSHRRGRGSGTTSQARTSALPQTQGAAVLATLVKQESWRALELAKTCSQSIRLPTKRELMAMVPWVTPNSMLLLTINGAGITIELLYILLFIFNSHGIKKVGVLLILLGEFVFVGGVSALDLLLAKRHERRALIIGVLCIFFGTMMYAAPLSVMIRRQ